MDNRTNELIKLARNLVEHTDILLECQDEYWSITDKVAKEMIGRELEEMERLLTVKATHLIEYVFLKYPNLKIN